MVEGYRTQPSDPLVVLKEYVSFGYPIPDIKKQMIRDGFDMGEINSAVNQLQREEGWREYVVNAVNELHLQGYSKNEVVGLLEISDEEYDSCMQYINARKASLSRKDRLLLLATRMEQIAQELEEKAVPRFRKIKPKEVDIPENLIELDRMDARKKLAKLVDRARVLPDEIENIKDKIAELKVKYVKPTEKQKKDLTEEELKVAQEILEAVEKELGVLDAGQQTTLRHRDNLLAVAKIMDKIPIEPSAQQKLDFVLDELGKTDAKLVERLGQMLDEFIQANTIIEETLSTIVAVFPVREKHLKGEVDIKKVATWLENVFDWFKGLIKRTSQFIRAFKSIDDDIDKNSGIVGELLQYVKAGSLQASVKEILDRDVH